MIQTIAIAAGLLLSAVPDSHAQEAAPRIKKDKLQIVFLMGQSNIYDRMAKILEGPENQFPMDKAYQEIIHRDPHNAKQLKRVRDIYLNGTQGTDFDPFLAGLESARKRKKMEATETPEEIRVRLAKLGEQTVKLPISKRTHIFSHGAQPRQPDGRRRAGNPQSSQEQ